MVKLGQFLTYAIMQANFIAFLSLESENFMLKFCGPCGFQVTMIRVLLLT